MVYLPTFCIVNVGKYTIHGSYRGKWGVEKIGNLWNLGFEDDV